MSLMKGRRAFNVSILSCGTLGIESVKTELTNALHRYRRVANICRSMFWIFLPYEQSQNTRKSYFNHCPRTGLCAILAGPNATLWIRVAYQRYLVFQSATARLPLLRPCRWLFGVCPGPGPQQSLAGRSLHLSKHLPCVCRGLDGSPFQLSIHGARMVAEGKVRESGWHIFQSLAEELHVRISRDPATSSVFLAFMLQISLVARLCGSWRRRPPRNRSRLRARSHAVASHDTFQTPGFGFTKSD